MHLVTYDIIRGDTGVMRCAYRGDGGIYEVIYRWPMNYVVRPIGHPTGPRDKSYTSPIDAAIDATKLARGDAL